MREENLLSEREELRARAQALERRRLEMMMELEKTRQSEEQWRSEVFKLKEEQEVKLKDLLGEIKRLKEREEEMEKWMSRLEEVKREVEESQAEHSSTISSSTRVTVMSAILEKQKTLAAEVVTEQEMADRQSDRVTDEKERSGGEVSRRGISFNRQKKECKT